MSCGTQLRLPAMECPLYREVGIYMNSGTNDRLTWKKGEVAFDRTIRGACPFSPTGPSIFSGVSTLSGSSSGPCDELMGCPPKPLSECIAGFLRSKGIDPVGIRLHRGAPGFSQIGFSVTINDDIYLTPDLYDNVWSDLFQLWHEIGHVVAYREGRLSVLGAMASYIRAGGHDSATIEVEANDFAIRLQADFTGPGGYFYGCNRNK